jgi:uncharacterized protein
MSYKSITTPIIKPVDGMCDLSCSYCYTSGLKNNINKNRMSLETLKATIDFFCNDQDDIEFIWHGGEPLLAGLEFYRKVIQFQLPWKQKGKNITNFIQTNATLITPEWVEFFAKNKFYIGVSLDGPKEFHDQCRYYPNNKGSYDDVMKGINLLRQAKIFNGVICGISSVNVNFSEKLFNFFINENIKKLKFTRIKNIGSCKDISSLVISPTQFTDFMINIFDLWLKLDDPEVEIRDIDSVVNLILGGNKRECIYMGQCDRFVTVYSDGSIYACDSFPKIDAVKFGSVFDNPTTIRSNLQLQHFRDLLEKRQDFCRRNCSWYFICKGGCAKDFYGQLDAIEPLSEMCENSQRYFEYVLNKIKSYNLL